MRMDGRALMRGKGPVPPDSLGAAQVIIQAHTDAIRATQRADIARSEWVMYTGRIAALAFVLACGLFFTSYIRRRLLEMHRATGAAQRGECAVTVPVRGHDELAALGNNFNEGVS